MMMRMMITVVITIIIVIIIIIREVEYAVFTPLVFSTTVGIGKETTVAYKCLAELVAQK